MGHIRRLRQLHQLLCVAVSACVDAHIDILLAARIDQRLRKGSMSQRFSAADGHAAAGVKVEVLVLQNDLHDLFHRHLLCHVGDGLGITNLAAFTAGFARCKINSDAILRNGDATFRTDSRTFSAPDAPGRADHHLVFEPDHLRIMTPDAA